MQLPIPEEARSPFLVAPVAILEIPGLSTTEKLVTLVLCSFADQHGRCRPTHAVLAERASLTRRTVTTALDSLIDRGLIRKDDDGLYLPFMDAFGDHIPSPRERPARAASPPPVADDDVRAVFAYWCERLGHPGAHLTKTRRDKIARRLREGLTVDEAKLVIDTCASSAFHTGQNDNGVRYDTVERHIFVSREKVEWWLSQAKPQTAYGDGRKVRVSRALRMLEEEGWEEDMARGMVMSDDEWDEVQIRRTQDAHS